MIGLPDGNSCCRLEFSVLVSRGSVNCQAARQWIGGGLASENPGSGGPALSSEEVVFGRAQWAAGGWASSAAL